MKSAVEKKSSLNKTTIPIMNKSFFMPVIQTKLIVNEPGDKFEKEADQTANEVINTNNPMHFPADANHSNFFNPQPTIQKHAEENTLPSSKPNDFINSGHFVHRQIQTKSVISGKTAETSDSPIVQKVLNSSGQPMDPSTRSYMEPRFGHDFSNVHIHTGTQADQANKILNARAFTCGQNIMFRQGEYEPGSNKGKELLAHELTHTIQQKETIGENRIQRQNKSNENVPKFKLDKNGALSPYPIYNAKYLIYYTLIDKVTGKPKVYSIPKTEPYPIFIFLPKSLTEPSKSQYKFEPDLDLFLFFHGMRCWYDVGPEPKKLGTYKYIDTNPATKGDFEKTLTGTNRIAVAPQAPTTEAAWDIALSEIKFSGLIDIVLNFLNGVTLFLTDSFFHFPMKTKDFQVKSIHIAGHSAGGRGVGVATQGDDKNYDNKIDEVTLMDADYNWPNLKNNFDWLLRLSSSPKTIRVLLSKKNYTTTGYFNKNLNYWIKSDPNAKSFDFKTVQQNPQIVNDIKNNPTKLQGTIVTFRHTTAVDPVPVTDPHYKERYADPHYATMKHSIQAIAQSESEQATEKLQMDTKNWVSESDTIYVLKK